MSAIQQAFQFDSLVWDWTIAIYLFLAGMSAGAVMLSVYLKRWVIDGDPAENGIIRAMAFLAPLGIVIGLLILVVHLTKPWDFWKIMIYYNPTSVMSMGVILFQVYMAVLFVWIGGIFAKPLMHVTASWPANSLIHRLLKGLAPWSTRLDWVMAGLAFVLAAYTGFLLSALKTYPLLNNPVLPILFLFSSLSSGIAACLLLGVLGFKLSPNSESVKRIHGIERPIVLFELFVLFAFFSGLYFGGGQRELAVINAIGVGFWAQWFWYGVIGVGMVIPLLLNAFVPPLMRHRQGFIVLVTSLSLVGVLMLRTFILYAGQMTTI